MKIIVCFLIACVIPVLCGSVRAVTVTVSADQKEPVLSSAPCLLTLTWNSKAGELIPPGPVTLVFTDKRSGTVHNDIHYPPSSLPRDAIYNGSAAYTIPVFIPFQSSPSTWSVSIITRDHEYPDRLTLKVPATSVFQRLILPRPVSGWLTGTSSPELTGFYNRECTDMNECWIWMSGHGQVNIPNPMTDIVLKLTGWIPEHLNPGLSVTLNGRPIDTGRPANHHFFIDTVISAESLGTTPGIDLSLKTRELFVPASDGISADTRELGLMVKEFQIIAGAEEKNRYVLADVLNAELYTPSFWRMGSVGHLQISNPGREFEIFMKCRIPPGYFMEGVRLDLFLNGSHAGSVVPGGNEFPLLFRVSQEAISGSAVIDIQTVLEYPFLHVVPGLVFWPPGMTVANLWIN